MTNQEIIDGYTQMVMDKMYPSERGDGLHEIDNWIPGIEPYQKNEVVRTLEEEGLITTSNNLRYQLTSKGYRVKRLGWIIYKQQKEHRDKLDHDLADSVIKTNRFTTYILYLTAAITLLNLFFSILDYENNRTVIEFQEQLLNVEKSRDLHDTVKVNIINKLDSTTFR